MLGTSLEVPKFILGSNPLSFCSLLTNFKFLTRGRNLIFKAKRENKTIFQFLLTRDKLGFLSENEIRKQNFNQKLPLSLQLLNSFAFILRKMGKVKEIIPEPILIKATRRFLKVYLY